MLSLPQIDISQHNFTSSVILQLDQYRQVWRVTCNKYHILHLPFTVILQLHQHTQVWKTTHPPSPSPLILQLHQHKQVLRFICRYRVVTCNMQSLNLHPFPTCLRGTNMDQFIYFHFPVVGFPSC